MIMALSQVQQEAQTLELGHRIYSWSTNQIDVTLSHIDDLYSYKTCKLLEGRLYILHFFLFLSILRCTEYMKSIDTQWVIELY